MPRTGDPSFLRKGSGMSNQDSVDANAFVDEVVEGDLASLKGHINDAKNAHPASAISTTGSKGQYFTQTAQGNLDELAALVPPKPPVVGSFSYLPVSGIPDWGILKLRDAGFVARGDVDGTNPDAYVHSEFWYPPFEASDLFGTNPRGAIFDPPGNDPVSDPLFNVDPAGTGDPTYTGGGPGTTHQGGFTRGAREVIETARIIPVGPSAPVVVSGMVFPADRGVLALFHWPAGGDVGAFLAQPLDQRVLAALLLGQGGSDTCDGDFGGIFTDGDTIDAFPGRYTGQYDLYEIHAGVDSQTGDALPGGPDPTAGQVRLGTDPQVGPVIPGGIKILGGSTLANGGGNDNNFFRYRLPYLQTYTSLDQVPEIQRPRYFDKPPVAQDHLTALSSAGGYAGYPKDYATFQVARYRHRFSLLSPPSDQGSYFLLHFKKEQDFEAFAQSGVMPGPSTYELWSEGLVNYLTPESTDNLIDAADPAAPLTASSYHVLRAAVFEDPNSVPAAFASTYTYTSELDEVMFLSGVQYFLPNGSTGAGTNWTIPELTLGIGALWDNAYVLGNHVGPTDITPGLWHRTTVALYLGIATSLETSIQNGAGPGYTGLANFQRVDFDYTDLGSISGPFSLIQGPLPGQTADIVLTLADTAISFTGDDEPCFCWHGMKLRAFAHKPLGQQDPSTASTELVFPDPGGDQILIHTTSHSPNLVSLGSYGNFTVPPFNTPRPTLENARKDVEERFLDEVYRVSASIFFLVDPTWDGAVGNLVGPGLPFPSGPIELPVRFASSSAIYGAVSFLQQQYHLLNLAADAQVNTELQVAGLPDRSPLATGGSLGAGPYAGRLIYPNVDYTTGYRPSVGGGDTSIAQYDYSTAVGVREYIRVFDAAYFNDPNPETGVVGQSFLYFLITGLQAADFAYSAPGPGNPNIAILIKIPGLTTWMDLGRADGSGPSKQDPLADGAGCRIEAVDGFDAQSRCVNCLVKANVGPFASVFENTVLLPPDQGIAPILVKIIMSPGSVLNFTQGGPNADPDVPRALVGITLLRLSTQTGPDPFPVPAFP